MRGWYDRRRHVQQNHACIHMHVSFCDDPAPAPAPAGSSTPQLYIYVSLWLSISTSPAQHASCMHACMCSMFVQAAASSPPSIDTRGAWRLRRPAGHRETAAPRPGRAAPFVRFVRDRALIIIIIIIPIPIGRIGVTARTRIDYVPGARAD